MAARVGTSVDGTINHIELRQARQALGFTEEYVCLRSGITRNTLSRYELGIGKPTFHILENIAKVYDMQAEDFLTPASMVMLARVERALYDYTENLEFGNNHIAALGWFDRLTPLVQIRHEREMATHEEEVLRLQVELEKTRKETAALELQASETRRELLPSGVVESRGDGEGTELEQFQEPEIVSVRQPEPPEGEE